MYVKRSLNWLSSATNNIEKKFILAQVRGVKQQTFMGFINLNTTT